MPIDVNENTIRIRQTDPSQYEKFRTIQITTGIQAIIGFKAGGGSEIQSYLFDRDKFTEATAKEWIAKHKSTKEIDGRGYFKAQVQITSLKEQFADIPKHKPNDDKREIVIPLLIEGWGNAIDNNYYTQTAVSQAAVRLKEKKKMYLNHPKAENDARDLKDWAASIQETWVETLTDGRKAAVGRVKIYDNWLWERCKIAPDEIADSLIGRGVARKGIIDGKSGNIIEGIEYVNSCDFVDYGGNVPFGMTYFIENDRQKNKDKQEAEMLITEITVEMIKESRPEIIAEITKVVVEEKDKKVSELEAKIKDIEKSSNELKAQLEAIKLKEQMTLRAMQKKEVVEKCLKESKLPEVAKTDIFTGILMSVEESKKTVESKEMIVTVEEQVKSLIADREVILGIPNPIKNMGEVKKVEEGDIGAQKKFNEMFFGIKEEKKEDKKIT